MRYAVITNDLATFRIGQAVKANDSDVCDGEYVALDASEHCTAIRKDALRFISKEEYDLLKAKTEAIKKLISIIDDEDNLHSADKLSRFYDTVANFK